MSLLLTLLAALKSAAQRLTADDSAALRAMDDRMLADIGLDRSEITSVEAEGLGRSALTRRRIVAASWHHA